MSPSGLQSHHHHRSLTWLILCLCINPRCTARLLWTPLFNETPRDSSEFTVRMGGLCSEGGENVDFLTNGSQTTLTFPRINIEAFLLATEVRRGTICGKTSLAVRRYTTAVRGTKSGTRKMFSTGLDLSSVPFFFFLVHPQCCHDVPVLSSILPLPRHNLLFTKQSWLKKRKKDGKTLVLNVTGLCHVPHMSPVFSLTLMAQL